jgi:tetratricopeptide (TPR) repeat protein
VAAEKERGAFLSTIDRLNTTFFPPTVKLSEKELNAEARKLSDKIASIKGKAELQEAYFNLGNVYLLAADVRNAETALAAAWQVIPDNDIAVKAKFNLAWFYKIIGKYEEAATYFGKITKEFPKSELAIVSRIETADILYKRKEYLKARDMYAALAKEYPAAEFAKFTLFRAGYISLYNLNDKKAALRFFALLEKILPDEAIASYTKTHMRKVIFGKIVSEGYKALMENKYDEAIKKFKKATKVNPHDPASYSGMGVGYFWLDKKDKALEKAREAVSLSAEDEIALTNSLYIYIMSNKIDDAIKLANDVLNKTPIANAEFHYNLGCANLKKNDVNKAKGTFIHAIEKDSSLACAYNNLGYVYWLDGDYAEAVVKFKEAIGINPKYALAHYNLGVIYFYLNQPEEAYKEFKGALRIKPSDAKASDYLRRLEGILKYKPE